MSVNTNTNISRYPGYNPKQETTTFGSVAPTITTGYLPGDEFWVTTNGLSTGTVKAVYRFDGVTSTWKLYPTGGTVPVLPALVPVLDILDTPPSTPTDQDSYIVKATATGDWAGKEGDIATWSNADNKWVFYSPANNDTTSVLTGDSIGTWVYNSTTDEWAQTSTTPIIVETSARPTWGNMAFVSEAREYRRASGCNLIISNDQLMTWGPQAANLGAGDNSNANRFPRKISWVDSNIVANAATTVAKYVPKFVDGSYTNNVTFALDHMGKVWWMGNNLLGTGATTTPDGTTASAQSWLALAPIAYFQNKPDLIVTKIITGHDRFGNSTFVTAVIANNGDMYVTGANAVGQLGNGNTTNSAVWIKYPISGVKDVKIANRTVFALTISGDLYVSGYANAWIGTAGNRTTPTLVMSGVADYDYGGTDAESIIIAKTDGTLWTGGSNTYGQLGKGNTTNTTSITQVPGWSVVKKVYGNYWSNWTMTFITAAGRLVIAGRNNEGMLGIPSVAQNANQLTFVQPTGAFQGNVTSVTSLSRYTYAQTSNGELWQAGRNPDGGIGSMSATFSEYNLWKKQPLPGKVIDHRGYTDNAGQTGVVALCENFGMVGWGIAHMWNPQNNYSYAWNHIQNWFDNGIGITDVPKYVADVQGTVSSVTPVAVTSISDATNNQSVTFTFTVDAGTTGKLDFTGSTVTGIDITQVSLSTTSGFLSRIGQTLSITFVINAADDPALVIPNSQPQDWILDLVIN